uniref:DUF6510 family protein n=1 Tax=uncultured Sphingomonas sp. TaxID=158754 RepID=UPI0025DC7260|nr:DUF6510 family protein [uncultured Sphingomonas sp.]
MNDDPDHLDGNAAAGPLTTVFAVDMTRSVVVCAGCGREDALATLRLYGRQNAMVLRCPACEAVNLRLLDTGTTTHLDVRGCSRLSFATAPDARSAPAER